MQREVQKSPKSLKWTAGRARASGFTLIEMMIVLAIIGITVAIAAPNIGAMMRASRATTAAREIANLISVARSEAIRDGVNQVVVFNVGGLAGAGMPLSGDGNLTDPSGDGPDMMAMRFRDPNGDCVPSGGEVRGWVLFDPDLAFGANQVGGVSAPQDAGDTTNFDTNGITFVDTAGGDGWIGFVFTPDGLPRSFKVNGTGTAANIGAVGSGRGAVYFEMENPPRSYAVQVSAGGSVVVGRFGGGAWK